MGYTHYWRRTKKFDPEKFARVVEDFKKVLHALDVIGVKLAGGYGSGKPEINEKLIWFNGPKNCGHPINHHIGIAWAAKNACGVGKSASISGYWFAGAELEKRACDGDCSHETFDLPLEIELREWNRPDAQGRYFNFCKTAFKPYDLAVTVALVIAKHYLGKDIVVSSDGEVQHWMDAVLLCEQELGYGEEFRLPK